MFGMPLPLEELQLPPGCAFTINRGYWREASAVMFHIPTLRRLYGLRRPPGHSPDARSGSVMENRRLAMAEKKLSHKREALANRVWQIPPRQ